MLVAQLVEQRTFNPLVLGSSPSERNHSPGGGIGRRSGLKIRRPKNHVGSIPTLGIMLRDYMLNKIEQTTDSEEVEILATFLAIMNALEYVKELDPELYRKAKDFGFETVDIPGISFIKEEEKDDHISDGGAASA